MRANDFVRTILLASLALSLCATFARPACSEVVDPFEASGSAGADQPDPFEVTDAGGVEVHDAGEGTDPDPFETVPPAASAENNEPAAQQQETPTPQQAADAQQSTGSQQAPGASQGPAPQQPEDVPEPALYQAPASVPQTPAASPAQTPATVAPQVPVQIMPPSAAAPQPPAAPAIQSPFVEDVQRATSKPSAKPATPQDPCGAVELKPLNQLGISIAQTEGKLPTDLATPCWEQINQKDGRLAARCWPVLTYQWDATCFCHQPLYFEEINLERYGYQCGDKWCCTTCGQEFCCLQPAASAAHFFGTIPALPYCLIAEPPCECVYTLGHYRPGSCNPWRWHWPPCDTLAAMGTAGFYVGMIAAFP